jgi:hypothetical protein
MARGACCATFGAVAWAAVWGVESFGQSAMSNPLLKVDLPDDSKMIFAWRARIAKRGF